MGSIFTRFRRCGRGALTVEYALALLGFLTVLVVAIETLMALFIYDSLERGLRSGARFGATGQSEGEAGRSDRIKAAIRSASLGVARPENTVVAMSVFAGPGDIGRTAGTSGPGTACDLVVYRVTYSRKPMTRPVAELLKAVTGSSELTLRASTVVRNEPYAEGATGCPA